CRHRLRGRLRARARRRGARSGWGCRSRRSPTRRGRGGGGWPAGELARARWWRGRPLIGTAASWFAAVPLRGCGWWAHSCGVVTGGGVGVAAVGRLGRLRERDGGEGGP